MLYGDDQLVFCFFWLPLSDGVDYDNTQCLVSFMLVLSLGTLGDRQDSRKGAWRSGLLTEMARALPPNALLGGWNSKSLLGGGAEAVVSAITCFICFRRFFGAQMCCFLRHIRTRFRSSLSTF